LGAGEARHRTGGADLGRAGGKSRLAEALAERIAAEPHTRLRYFCSPHHQDNALCPVIAQMERAAGFAHGDAPAARFAKLRALLAATGPPMEDVALIAELHSRPSVDLAPLLDVTSQRKREKTFEALLQQVEGFGQPRPVLMLFDCCSMTSIGSTRVRGNCWTA
jgi:predicted ATPase